MAIKIVKKLVFPQSSDEYMINAARVSESLIIGDKTYNGSHEVKVTLADFGIDQPMKFIGVCSTELTDGDTTNPITINGVSVTAIAGNVVLLNDSESEFIWTGTYWELLGSLRNITTDELQAGTETWHFNCGTASTVID